MQYFNFRIAGQASALDGDAALSACRAAACVMADQVSGFAKWLLSRVQPWRFVTGSGDICLVAAVKLVDALWRQLQDTV